MKGTVPIYKLCEFEVSADDCNTFLPIFFEVDQCKGPPGTLHLYHKKLNTAEDIQIHSKDNVFLLSYLQKYKMK